MNKPTKEEVYDYAKKKIEAAIYSHARGKPHEQIEEATQDAWLRVFEAYERLDRDTWKSFIATHANGAVLDYFKLGKGHLEDRKGKEDKKDKDGNEIRKSRENIKMRVSYTDDENKDFDIDAIAGLNGVFTSEYLMEEQDIKWDLVAKMASADSAIHLLAKLILGFSMDELSDFFKCSKETLSRRYRRFLKRINMPSYARDPWMDQFIFAFGLSEMFHLKEVDNGLGHDYQAVDLYSKKPLKLVTENDGPAYSWIAELFPESQSHRELEGNINWKILSRMAAIDEDLCLAALILKGFSRLKLAEIFDDTPESLKSRCLRFVRKLDSAAFYEDEWIKQSIFALGLSEEFHQEGRDYGLATFVIPLDFSSFQNYKKAIQGKNQTNFLEVI
jgi:DNA-directed RNA polymerase specialized sigma24 family protein